MSEPLARLYDLALRTLDDQERRADAIRGRLAPVLAAAALGTTLLSGPLVGDKPPASTPGNVALLIAIGSLFGAVGVAAQMLSARRPALSDIDIPALAERLALEAALDDLAAFYSTMTARLSREAAHNAALLDQLQVRFTAMLCAILTMLCGLALAALVG